jgi:3-oxoacyl-[acyl-carrier-protein] synthase II
VVSARVTGLAWSTPLGTGLDEVWQALLDGAGGVRELPFPHRLRSSLAAAVPAPPPHEHPAQRQVALAAGTLAAAFADAGLAADDPGVRIVLGTSYGGDLDDPDTISLHQWARLVARRAGHPHEPVTVTTACSAGADSVLVGAALIAAGQCEVAVCGGADVITAAKRLGHSALGTMSTTGLRAFDDEHDGMVLGEGAAFLVLEHTGTTRPAYATLSGAGSANDAATLTAPDTSGAAVALAVRRALLHSGLSTADIAVVSAHGSGTPLSDRTEAACLSELFSGNDFPPVVFATKGALGHSLGATGAIEAITVILALRDGVVPPVAGLRSPLAPLAPLLPAGSARRFTGTAGISLTLGFGGFDTCLLFTRGSRS